MLKTKPLTQVAALLLGTSLAASALALTPGSGKWIAETATYGTPTLKDAFVYVPANPAPQVLAGKRALMLTLHGCGMTAKDSVIDKRFNWEATAEKYGMVVVAPTVPTGTSSTRVAGGCWDWFGPNHSRTSRDAVPLMKLINAIKARPELDIDPNQIYVSGLSSGAGETHVLGCSFPDVFAGVAPVAAPTLGSEAGDISVSPKLPAEQVAQTCRAINGNQFNAWFDTQLFAIAYGDKDYLVLPAHNVRNTDGMKIVYGANVAGGAQSVAGGGTAELWKDSRGKQRISRMVVGGMSHAWPAGPNGVGVTAWVDNTRVNFPAYVTEFFFKNNLRVKTWEISCSAQAMSDTSARISASGMPNDGATVARYQVTLKGKTPVSDTNAGSGASFSKTYTLGNGSYTGTVVGVDSKGVESAACDLPAFQVGQLDPFLPPQNPRATPISSSAIKLTWDPVPEATGYRVMRSGTLVASVTGTEYIDNGLAAKTSYSYTIIAVKNDILSAPSTPVIGTTLEVTYTEKVTATVTGHYAAGRLNVNQYLQLGAKYGYNTSITLYKCEGVWTNSSSCGPLQ